MGAQSEQIYQPSKLEKNKLMQKLYEATASHTG
jgi:hypothetical protein